MIWLETPTNPLLKLIDIKAVAESLKSRPDIVLVIDNTFLTSYFQVSLRKITFNRMRSMLKVTATILCF